MSSRHTHCNSNARTLIGKDDEGHTGETSSVLELEKPDQQPLFYIHC